MIITHEHVCALRLILGYKLVQSGLFDRLDWALYTLVVRSKERVGVIVGLGKVSA